MYSANGVESFFAVVIHPSIAASGDLGAPRGGAFECPLEHTHHLHHWLLGCLAAWHLLFIGLPDTFLNTSQILNKTTPKMNRTINNRNWVMEGE